MKGNSRILKRRAIKSEERERGGGVGYATLQLFVYRITEIYREHKTFGVIHRSEFRSAWSFTS